MHSHQSIIPYVSSAASPPHPSAAFLPTSCIILKNPLDLAPMVFYFREDHTAGGVCFAAIRLIYCSGRVACGEAGGLRCEIRFVVSLGV